MMTNEKEGPRPADPVQNLLQQLLVVNQQILVELQKQTTLLNNLSLSLTPFGGKQ